MKLETFSRGRLALSALGRQPCCFSGAAPSRTVLNRQIRESHPEPEGRQDVVRAVSPGGLFTALLLAWILVGCGTPVATTVDLATVDHPDTSAIEPIAQRQIDDQRSTLDDRLARATEARELADAFGGLGEIYMAYGLDQAALTCFANAQTLDPESFSWPYYLGVLHQRLGDSTAARTAFQQALERRDGNPPTQLRLANTLLDLGEVEGAAEYLGSLEAIDGFEAAHHYGLGRIVQAQGDAAAALGHFEAALGLQPDAGTLNHALGMAHRTLGNLEKAEELLAASSAGEVTFPDPLMERIDKHAISSGAHMRRGNQALLQGDLDTAVGHFRNAVDANPDNSEAFRNLGLTRVRQGDLDGALEILKEGAGKHPDNVWIHFDLGTTYMAKGLQPQAMESFDRALEISPDQPKVLFNAANTLIALERWDDADRLLDRLLELDPEDRRARYLAAMAQHHQGESDAAIEALRALLAEEPTDLVARRGLLSLLEAEERIPMALALYEQSADLDIPKEDKVDLLNSMAQLAWRRNQRPQALTAWQKAIRVAPDSTEAHTALANGLQLMGRRKPALKNFAKAVELDPQNATAWLSEASLWILEKEFLTARQRLEEGLEHNPEHPGLNNTLARLLATSTDIAVRDGDQALTLAQKAYSLDPGLEYAETLGMALAASGRFEQAIQWQRRLITQMAQGGDRPTLQRLATHLRLYENRRAVRVE